MELNLGVSKERVNLLILRVLNTLTNHKESEIKIVATMLDNNIDRIDTSNRESVANLIGISTSYLNHCVWKLKERGTLIRVNNVYTIHPNILKAVKDKSVKITLHVN